MPLPEPLTDPVPLAILTLVLAAALHYQRGLTWTEYRHIYRLKRRWVPLLDKVWGHAIHEKSYRDDAEYLLTRKQSVKTVWKQLVAEGGSPHVLNSLKRRSLPDGTHQLSDAHVVWTHADGTQTEAYIFDNPGADTVDVYAHHESSVVDAEEHLEGEQRDGDPKGVVRKALGVRPA